MGKPTPTTTERPGTAPEQREAPGKKSASLEDYRKKAEKMESEPNKEAAEKIRLLKGSKRTAEQLEGLTALHQALTRILIKLAKKGVDISTITSTEQLTREIVKNGIELDVTEATAIENIDRIGNEPGETSTEIKKSWPDTVKTAVEGSKGWGTRYKEYLQKNPAGTIALTVAGAAGIYLAYEGIKSLGKWIFGEEGADKSKGGKSWFKKEIAIPVAIMIAGGILGKDVVAKMLADAGLDWFDVEDKVKKGKEFSQDEQRKLKSAGDKIQQRVDETKASGGQAPAAPTATPAAGGEGGAAPAPSEGPTYAQPVPPTPVPVVPGMPVAEAPGTPEVSGDKEEKKYKISEELFINVYFFEHSFKGRAKKNELRYVLDALRNRQIKLSQIQNIVKKHENEKRIPKNQFPVPTPELTDAQLFMLMHKLVSFSKLAGKLDGDPTIEKIFVAVANKPSYVANNIFHSNFVEKLKSGEFIDGLVGLDYEKINQEVIQKIKDGSIRIVEAINEKMNPELRERFNNLSEVEKKKVYEVQAALIAEANIRIPASQAVDEAIKLTGNKVSDSNTRQFLIDFFEAVKQKAKEVLPKAKKRFSITTVNGKSVNDRMESGIQFEKLSFLHAVEIVVAASDMNLDQEMKAGEEQYMQDMALLTILLRAMGEQDRRVYLAQLGTKIVDQDVDIRIPGLENLRPYFSSLAELGKSVIAEYGLKHLTTAITYADSRPEMGSVEFREKLKNNPIITFGREGAGGGIEIGRDSLAFLVSALGITPESFSNVETGEELMNLLMTNQNTQEVIYSKHTSMLAVQIAGKWIILKPLGIIQETFEQLFEGHVGQAVGTWLVGSSPFMVLGGAKEAYLTLARVNKAGVVRRSLPTKVLHILGGFMKGAKYPLLPFTLTKKGINAAFHSAQLCEHYARSGRQAFNWTTDIVRVRTLRQNVGNMLESGKWMKYYREQAKDLSARTWRDVWADAKTERVALAKRAIFSDFNKNMAVREALNFSGQYNDFFEFGKGSDKMLHLQPLKDMENLSETIDRATVAYERVQRFSENAAKSENVLEAMRDLTKKGLSKDELAKQIAVEIRKIAGLEEYEVLALSKQIREGNDVTKLMTRLKEGFEYFNRKKKIGEVAPKPAPTPEAPKPVAPPEAGKPKRLPNGKWSYGGEEYEISKADIKKMQKARNLNESKAIEAICDERWNRIEVEASTAEGGRVCRHRGVRITLTKEECATRTAIETNVKAKYQAMVEAAKQAPPAAAPEAAGAGPQAPAAKAEITKPVDLGNGKFRYMGEEIPLTEAEITGATTGALTREQAIQNLCEKKWSTPNMVKELANKNRIYRMRGAEFTLTPAEYGSGDLKVVTDVCDAKFAKSLAITDGRVVKGVAEFKIGDKWIKVEEGAGAMERAKADYIKAAKETGYQIDYNVLKNSKLLATFNVLQETAGPIMALYMIHHLEKASDKRKAIAETGIALGSFWATTKGLERATRKWTPKSVAGALGKGGMILLGSLAVSVGVMEPVSSVLEDLIPKFAGDQQISLELISFTEKWSYRSMTMLATRRLEAKLLSTTTKEFVEKKGLKTLAKLLGKKVESSVLKKVSSFVSKPVLKKLAVSLGVRGVVLAGLVADDATVIGVIDDVVAVGMAAWMAVDIYDVLVLANRAIKIHTAMEEYNKMPIADVSPATEVDKKAIEAACAVKGKTPDEMNDEELMEVIKGIADVRLKITRQGGAGWEEYRFVKGEVFSTKIKDKNGEILELSDEELNKEIAMGPPKEFDPKKFESSIDYNLPDEKLLANYRLAILYAKSECGWTKLDFEIKDKNTIVMKRLDGGQSLTITRSGTRWSVENYVTCDGLFQAFVLANLTNKVHGILLGEKYKGGSDKPFEIDGENIDFDLAWSDRWTPGDLRILAGETQWLAFYDKIGISKQTVVNCLNKWYTAKYKAIAEKF